MNIKDFGKLYEQIMENNSWKRMLINYNNDSETMKPIIKYVSFTIDTRDGEIYLVNVEPFSKDPEPFRVDTPDGLADLQAYLNKDVEK